MPITGFTMDDFAAMDLPGLEPRMAAIKDQVRPKLLALGTELAPFLAEATHTPMYPKVAMHTRRKVNPPNDTWIAWSTNSRGYKMVPHFQVGLWATHLFIQAGVIYEAQGRAAFGDALLANAAALRQDLPGHYRWLEDYTQPDGIPNDQITDADFARIAERLKSRKEADCMVGLSIPAAQAAALDGAGLGRLCQETMRTILPVYKLASLSVV